MKATSQKKARVSLKNMSVGMVSAMPASAMASMNCMVVTHHRFVFSMSTNGLHSGFITHGKYSQPV